MNARTPPIPVVFIAGSGRSGSTLLDRMLGQLEGAVSCGELYHIWDRSFSANQLCGCSETFYDCPFWQDVVAAAYGSAQNLDLESFLALRRYIHDRAHIPFHLVPELRTRRFQQELDKYTHVLGRLYGAIAEVSGARVIIDSSKNPIYGLALISVSNVELRLLHLVRDSRAVAYSWQKKRIRPEIQSRVAYMHQFSTFGSGIEWTMKNLLVHMLSHNCKKSCLVQYEDIMRSPRTTLESLATDLIGLDTAYDYIRRDEIEFTSAHIVAGNPNRFQCGTTKLQLDEEWRECLQTWKYGLTTGITLPLLLYYGYPIKPTRLPYNQRRMNHFG